MDDSGPLLVPPPPAACPRCGYDLRTAFKGWEDSCPLQGLCTECGLTFEWSDLFHPLRRPPRWNVEYTPLWLWPLAVVCTSTAAVLSMPLWLRLRLSMTWRPTRIAALLLTLLFPAIVVPWLGNCVLAGRFWWRHRDAADLMLRAGGVGLPPPIHAPGTNRGPSLLLLLGESLALPLASSSRVTVVLDGHELPIPAPRDHFLTLWDDRTRVAGSGGGGVFWDPTWSGSGTSQWLITSVNLRAPPQTITSIASYVHRALPRLDSALLAAQSMQMAAMVGIFALLPSTRRRCRVRWPHIARAALYSVVGPLLSLTALAPALVYIWTLTGSFWAWITAPQVLLALPVYCVLWWAAAIRFYLQMPHALATATLAALGGWMISAIIFWKVILMPLM